jgi:uncharacterized protein (UPF0335 family)
MAEAIGKNTPNSEKLRRYVDRVEAIDQQIKSLREDRARVMLEAKGEGFSARGMRHVFAARKLKPHDRQEQEAERDIYMHAMGMDSEPPLFRQIAAFGKDTLAAEKLTEAFKLLVPPGGEIILKIGGKPMRLWRDKDGEPKAEEYLPPDVVDNVGKGHAPARPPAKDVPVCSPEEADAMGEAAAKANIPVIENPFPYGHENRPRWDEGWRRGSGNNGMGG